MKLELKPELEAGLLAQAHARGLSLLEYLNEVLARAATPKKPRPAGRKSLALLFAESPLKGDGITVADGLVLATALEHELTLVTRNSRGF